MRLQRDDLVEAEVAQHVLGAAPQPLLAAQPADRAGVSREASRGRCSSKPWMRADLLDQVDLAGDVVVAVGRDGRPQVVAVALDLEAEPLEVDRPASGSISHARAARSTAPGAQGDRAAAGISAATSIVPGTSFAPQSSTISREATRWARIASSG